MRPEPFELDRETRILEIGDDHRQIGPEVMWEHETIVERGSPAHELLAIGLLPEHHDQRSEQELLRQAHTCVRRHLE